MNNFKGKNGHHDIANQNNGGKVFLRPPEFEPQSPGTKSQNQ